MGSPKPQPNLTTLAVFLASKWLKGCRERVVSGHRYYSPELGRWMNRDPIGEMGGPNLYGAMGNIPLSAVDSLGQDFVAIADKAVVGIFARHYSLQYWKCSCDFKRLYHVHGFPIDEVPRYCRGAKKVDSIEVTSDHFQVWAYQKSISVGSTPSPGYPASMISGWVKRNVRVAMQLRSDTECRRVMPIVNGNPLSLHSYWKHVVIPASEAYPWAEKDGDYSYSRWPRSLYHKLGTNSNTFIRHIVNSVTPWYWAEMTYPHQGKYTPSDNYVPSPGPVGTWFISSEKPWMKGTTPTPKPSYIPVTP